MRAPALVFLLLGVACGGRYTSSREEAVSLPGEGWPGGGVVEVDTPEQFQGNLSGLAYESDGAHSSAPGVMWAVSNMPGKLYRLLSEGNTERTGHLAPNSLVSDPDSNHEGIAIAPDSECDAAWKPFFWADENDTDGHSIRQGRILCAPR